MVDEAKKPEKVRLNLGCGGVYMPGWVNIDNSKLVKADQYFDFDQEWPFEDDTFDEVTAHNVLEHSKNYLGMLKELWRTCKNGTVVHVTVPYVTRSTNNLVNPYHHQRFNENSFHFFERGKLKGSANEEVLVLFRTISVEFHYFDFWNGFPEKVRAFARQHLFNVVTHLMIDIEVNKPEKK